jgi:hypothetical protein
MTEKLRQQEAEEPPIVQRDTLQCPRSTSGPAKMASSFHTCGVADPIVVRVTAEVRLSDDSAAVAGGGEKAATLTSTSGSASKWNASFSGLPVTPSGDYYRLKIRFYERNNILKTLMTQTVAVVSSGGSDCTSATGGPCS